MTMQTVTVKYGVESFTKNYESTPTFGQLASDASLKAVLGFGDNVRTLLDGVEQPANNLVPQGAIVRIETRANSKAGIITIKIGGSTIQKNVDDGYTASEILEFVSDADLDSGMSDPCVWRNGNTLPENEVINAGDVIEIVDRPAACESKIVTVGYGVEEHQHTLSCGETFGQIATNGNLKSILGFGDNVRTLVDGVEQAATTVIPNGVFIRIETRANAKA